MKRVWVILLLLSLGLNIGLGLHVLRDRGTVVDRTQRAGRWSNTAVIDRERVDHQQRRRLERMIRDLNLDETQRAQLTRLHQEASGEVFARRTELASLRERMHTLFTAPSSSWSDLRDVMRQHSDAQAELDSLVVDVMFRERGVLSPAQRQQYPAFAMPFGGRAGPGGPGEHRRGHGRRDRPQSPSP